MEVGLSLLFMECICRLIIIILKVQLVIERRRDIPSAGSLYSWQQGLAGT